MSNVIRFPVSRRAPAPEPLWREALGEVVHEARQDREERIVDVAGRAGIAPQYLSEIERGRKDASSEVLGAVAGALDLTVSEVTQRVAGRLGRGTVRLAA